MFRIIKYCFAAFFLLSTNGVAEQYIIAETGGDYLTIQTGLNVAVAGDSVVVKSKTTPYFEKITFPASGDSILGYITLMAFPGDRPVIDGTNVNGANMMLLNNRSFVRIIGFEIQNNLNVHDGSGIRITGSGNGIELINNRIHDMRGSNAMGITIYGTEVEPIQNLLIDQNEIFDCEPAQSEALVLNGNVRNFRVTNNFIHDVNNIGQHPPF